MLYNSPALLYNVGKRGDTHEKTNACAAAGSALRRTDGLRQHGHRRKGRNAVRAVRRAARAGTHAGGDPPDGGGAVCGRLDARGAGRADVLRALSGNRRGGADGAVRYRRLSAVCARF